MSSFSDDLRRAFSDPIKLGMQLLDEVGSKDPSSRKARRLVAEGADVRMTDSKGFTALHWAARSGYPRLAKALIARGADPNAPGKNDYTPLIFAVAAHDFETVQLLIKAGANTNAQEYRGYTPLVWSVAGGNVKMTRELLKNGANPLIKDRGGKTPSGIDNIKPEIADMLNAYAGHFKTMADFDEINENLKKIQSMLDEIPKLLPDPAKSKKPKRPPPGPLQF